jgi:hypothetical protein
LLQAAFREVYRYGFQSAGIDTILAAFSPIRLGRVSPHKRGGGAQPISLDAAPMVSAKPQPEVLAIDDVLKALAKVDSRKSQVVELRYFGGLTSRKLLRFSRFRQIRWCVTGNGRGPGCYAS